MIPAINLEDKTKQIDKPWSPIEVARVNDQVVRISLLKGQYHWHEHTDEDELFYVYKGSIIIQLKEQPDIVLDVLTGSRGKGEMAVIPKGVEHRPKSVEPSYVLLFEPHLLETRGD